MKTALYSLLLTGFLFQTSIYSFVINGANGTSIDFDDFHNKKILLVNIATGSDRVGQLGELQQLHEQHGDSLVIIGFPTPSFGHEARSNEQIVQFCQSEYSVSFPIAAKGWVKGSAIHPLYAWLTRLSENGVLDSEVKSDFQKYLVDRNGELLGIFSGSVSPLDAQIVSNITSTSH